MGQPNKIIEMNGRRYDAVTGAILGNVAPGSVSRGGSIDGFRRVRRSDITTGPLTPIPAVKKPAPAVIRKPHEVASHAAPHQPQKAVTLMRAAVHKPEIAAPSVIKARPRTDLPATTSKVIQPQVSITSVNVERRQRAERLIKSPAISRYPAAAAPIQPARRPVAAVQQVAQVALESNDDSALFEQALAAAHQPAKTTARKRGAGRKLAITGASLLVVGAIGFLTYVNMPNLNLQLASHRAGLHAKLPAWSPNGYDYNHVYYQPGNVTVNYTSASKEQQYSISQKPSTWDSQALLNNFVSSANSAYKTYQQAGRTIYVLGENSTTATWVDSGIWYTVDGNAGLSSNDLVKLAGSL